MLRHAFACVKRATWSEGEDSKEGYIFVGETMGEAERVGEPSDFPKANPFEKRTARPRSSLSRGVMRGIVRPSLFIAPLPWKPRSLRRVVSPPRCKAPRHGPHRHSLPDRTGWTAERGAAEHVCTARIGRRAIDLGERGAARGKSGASPSGATNSFHCPGSTNSRFGLSGKSGGSKKVSNYWAGRHLGRHPQLDGPWFKGNIVQPKQSV